MDIAVSRQTCWMMNIRGVHDAADRDDVVSLVTETAVAKDEATYIPFRCTDGPADGIPIHPVSLLFCCN
jgi:hypothetical protein